MGMLEQTAAQYRSLRMTSIAAELAQLLAEAEASEMSFLSFAQRLAEYELQQRQANRVQRNYKTAGFPAHKHLEGFDYRHQTTISKRQINSLLDFRFIDERNNVIFIGPPGVGKTHGHRDWPQGRRGRIPGIVSHRAGVGGRTGAGRNEGRAEKKISQLSKVDLLIIDELGYLPMTRQARYNLFQLINSLYEYRSIILTTNKDFTCWGEFFHDDNVAVPIIDRIIHHSHIFMLGGESYRLKQKTTG